MRQAGPERRWCAKKRRWDREWEEQHFISRRKDSNGKTIYHTTLVEGLSFFSREEMVEFTKGKRYKRLLHDMKVGMRTHNDNEKLRKKAEARRNESEMRAGLSDKDRAAIRIQHHARAVSKFKKIKERQLVEADEKKRRASKLMEERQRVMTAGADARRRSTPDMFKNMPPPKSGGSGSIGLGTPPKTGSTGVSR